MLRLKALDHVGLVVSDLDRSLRFYTEGLGLELLRRRERDGGASSAVLRVGNQEINVFCDPALAVPDSEAPQRIGHFCLEVDCASIEEVIAALRAAGIAIAGPPAQRRDGAAVFVTDPDGIRVELQIKA
jgi:catechol 2,3-dioxygenase-like lactoylglutathione lyase family enzyme